MSPLKSRRDCEAGPAIALRTSRKRSGQPSARSLICESKPDAMSFALMSSFTQ
jgi:hypothetical protein